MKMSFKSLGFLVLFSISTESLAQQDDVFMATGDDIKQFDQVLSKQPLPPGSERVLERLERRVEQGQPFQPIPPEGQGSGRPPEDRAAQRPEMGDRGGLRQGFDGPSRPMASQPPPVFRLGDQQRPPLGPEREQGRRRQPPPEGNLPPPPPPPE